MRKKIIAVLIALFAVSLTFMLITPEVSAYGDWNAACVKSCNNGYTICVSGCHDPNCHWWCYDIWLTCVDACSRGGIMWEPNYYC
jgi:hypothetical protein